MFNETPAVPTSSQDYVSKDLSHFVGWGNKSLEVQYQILLKILRSGQLIHPPTQNLVQRKGGSIVVDTPTMAPGSGFMISNFSAEAGPGGRSKVEVDFTLVDNTAKISQNEMYIRSMICFCDIPHSQLPFHMRKYGRIGLSFPKAFLIRQGVNPVHYIAKDSLLSGWNRDNSEWTHDTPAYQKVVAQEIELNQRLNSGEVTDPESLSALKQDYEAARARTLALLGEQERMRNERDNAPITRAELYDREVAYINEVFTRVSRTLGEAGDRDAMAMQYIRSFIASNVFCYLKCFDVGLEDSDLDNYYMEREWRALGTIKFELNDIAEVFVPVEFEDQLKRDTEFTGKVHQT